MAENFPDCLNPKHRWLRILFRVQDIHMAPKLFFKPMAAAFNEGGDWEQERRGEDQHHMPGFPRWTATLAAMEER